MAELDDSSTPASRNFKVVVRVRPSVQREESCQPCVDVTSRCSITVTKTSDVKGAERERPSTSTKAVHSFVYDRVFDQNTSQVELYEHSVQPVVLSALEGYNGSVIAYGQTGTGKTHTIEGELDPESQGIIPRAANQIFEYIQSTSDSDTQWLVRVSFLQIYNERISDLLEAGRDNLRIRESGDGGVFVEGLSEHVVKCSGDVYRLLQKGKAERTTNSTRMNKESSRSHAVFTVVVERSTSHPGAPRTVTVGKLHLVDLAGSERFDAVEEERHKKETQSINTSLSVFGKVVLALTSRAATHTPYRDSKLTRILQDSLGGNCKTTMISTISPASVSYSESINTLKFANRAKSVKNVAVVNEDTSQSAMLSSYQAEIERLRRQLKDSAAAVVVPTAPVDVAEVERLKSEQKQARLEKTVIVTELARRQLEIEAALQEKMAMEKRIQDLETMVISGGTRIQDTSEFHSALQEEKQRMQQEQQEQMSAIQTERLRLQAEKEAFERERRQFAAAQSGPCPAASAPPPPVDAVVPSPPASARPAVPVAAQLMRKFGRAVSRPSIDASLSTSPPTPTDPPVLAPSPPADSSGPPRTLLQRASRISLEESAGEARERELSPRPPSRPRSQEPAAGPAGVAARRVSVLAARALDLAESDSDDDIPAAPLAMASPPQSAHAVSPPYGAAHPPGPMYSQPHPPHPPGPRPAYSPSTRTIESPPDRPATAARDDDSEALQAYALALADPETGIPLATRRVRLTTYRNSFTGTDAARWFVDNMEGVTTVEQAQAVGQNLLDLGVFLPLRGDRTFAVSDTAVYGFRQRNTVGSSRPVSGRSSVSSFSRASSGTLARAGSASTLSMATRRSDSPEPDGIAEDLSDALGANELHMAASKGDTDAFKTLTKILDVDCPDSIGRTAIMYAALANQGRAVRALIKMGADVNVRDDSGNSALLLAATRGHAELGKVLLRAGADVDAADGMGRTAVHWAAKARSPALLEALLPAAYKMLVNRRDDEQLTPLHWAALSNHAAHMRLLLLSQGDATVGDTEQRTPLHYAVSRGALDCVQLLVGMRPDLVNVPDSSGRTALHVACGEGGMETVQALLAVPGANVAVADCRLTTPLHWAAVCNRPEVCRALVQRGAPLAARDMQGLTPMHYAHKKGHAECIGVLQHFVGQATERSSRRSSVA